MKPSLATQIKNKSAKFYATGIIGFSAVIGILVTVILIVNRNSG